MNSSDTLNKAFQILGELMNEDCFDFLEVASSTFEERKEYLRDMIFEYFHSGETNLGGMIQRVDSDDYLFEGIASPETIQNINDFFTNEELVADIILLMDEDIYYEYIDELNNK
jgi:hypothetical protein